MTPVILVAGPPLAGVDGVVAAVRARLPDAVVEVTGTRPPDVVLAVVSAAAPMTRSDWASVELVAERAGVVLGVVSKVDAHLGWRDVMAANRELVASWDARYRSTPWLGVAAAPDLGAPHVDELVDLIREEIFRIPPRRNRMRSVAAGCGPDPAEARRALQRSRLRLLRVVRELGAAWRAEQRAAAAEVGPGATADFEATVAAAALDFHLRVAEEVDREIATAAAEVGAVSTPPAPSYDPPETSGSATSSRRLEGRLAAVLGVGFGLGIALASSRLLAWVVPGWSAAGWVLGTATGLALVVWVVRTRRLLNDRAALDRWVVEVAATLRWHGEATVAERLLAAESAWAVGPHPVRRNRASTTGQLTRDYVTDQYEWC
ncbi:hypothetical protein [Mycobacterium sp. NPDC006124]|uniref:hypothetical protein n=1 Tax=Mycobacterium sp. NPDC006124 TaxID=3156729 RepID=UPI0033AFE69E